ncbi:MAG: zinc-ribbon domain-containing protein, partial [Nitrososphaerales archaeon]
MYCPKCGKQISDDSVYCPNCRTQLKGGSVSTGAGIGFGLPMLFTSNYVPGYRIDKVLGMVYG